MTQDLFTMLGCWEEFFFIQWIPGISETIFCESLLNGRRKLRWWRKQSNKIIKCPRTNCERLWNFIRVDDWLQYFQACQSIHPTFTGVEKETQLKTYTVLQKRRTFELTKPWCYGSYRWGLKIDLCQKNWYPLVPPVHSVGLFCRKSGTPITGHSNNTKKQEHTS